MIKLGLNKASNSSTFCVFAFFYNFLPHMLICTVSISCFICSYFTMYFKLNLTKKSRLFIMVHYSAKAIDNGSGSVWEKNIFFRISDIIIILYLGCTDSPSHGQKSAQHDHNTLLLTLLFQVVQTDSSSYAHKSAQHHHNTLLLTLLF